MYLGIVVLSVLGVVSVLAEASMELRDHMAQTSHPGSIIKEDLYWGIGFMMAFGGGLVGVIYSNISKRMDELNRVTDERMNRHGDKIDAMSTKLSEIGSQVTENTRFRLDALGSWSRDMASLRESVQALMELTKHRRET